jgi:uncharacterized membrane protein YgdD (TMEM256/DUF423 family)
VAAGAFGAHGVSDETAKTLLKTGAEYELIHTLAVFAALAVGGRAGRIAAWLFLIGGALFGGSLYLLAVTGVRLLGAVTPIGGLMLLLGWLALAWSVVAQRNDVETGGR